jgi:hypothetical protein
MHPDVIATHCNISEITVATLHDNTPAVFWQKKGSQTTTGPAAYLLRLLHTRLHAGPNQCHGGFCLAIA